MIQRALRLSFASIVAGGVAAVFVPWLVFALSTPFRGRLSATIGFSLVAGEKLWSSCLRMPEKAAVAPDKDWTAVAVGAGYLAVFYVCLVEVHRRRDGFPSTLAAVAGVLLFVLGLALRTAALRRLGARWSIQLDRAEAPDELVRTGPYRFIRHPVYLAAMCEVLGLAMAFATPAAFVVGALLFCPAELLRARFEERVLTERFGARYAAYAREVGGFLPRFRG